jgi:peptide deformylase
MQTAPPILQLGHPQLRHSAITIADPQSLQVQQWIDQLLHQMETAGGVGIAAPQLGIAQQLMIVASRPTPRYPQAPEMPPTVMINPQILDRSRSTEKGWEGCLSVPGLRGLVPRHTAITVSYQDRTGNTQQQDLSGFIARVFQHEYDHLQGILFVDRVESTQELMTEQEYKRQILGDSTLGG